MVAEQTIARQRDVLMDFKVSAIKDRDVLVTRLQAREGRISEMEQEIVGLRTMVDVSSHHISE